MSKKLSLAMFYLYILYSLDYDKYYVGYTDNYRNRLEEHNTSDRKTFTKKYRPWQIAAVFSCGEDRGNAMKIEKFVKRKKSRTLIKTMISGAKLNGELAQLVRVPYVRD
jgi:putative endonuclease